EPEQRHQRQIKAGAPDGVRGREGEEQAAAARDQPDLVSVPDRADGRQHLASLAVGAGHEQVQDAGAEVEPVQDDIHGQHDGDDAVPEGDHGSLAVKAGPGVATDGSPGVACSGPWAISRPTRKRNSSDTTAWRPQKPSVVKAVSPAATRGEEPSAVRMSP